MGGYGKLRQKGPERPAYRLCDGTEFLCPASRFGERVTVIYGGGIFACDTAIQGIGDAKCLNCGNPAMTEGPATARGLPLHKNTTYR